MLYRDFHPLKHLRDHILWPQTLEKSFDSLDVTPILQGAIILWSCKNDTMGVYLSCSKQDQSWCDKVKTVQWC